MSRQSSALWKTFKAPTWIGLLTAFGLFAALLGDGWWDVPVWLGMGIASAYSVRGLLR